MSSVAATRVLEKECKPPAVVIRRKTRWRARPRPAEWPPTMRGYNFSDRAVFAMAVIAVEIRAVALRTVEV